MLTQIASAVSDIDNKHIRSILTVKAYWIQEGGLSTIEILQLNGQTAAQQADVEAAEKAFSTALKSLSKLEKAFNDTEGQFPRYPS